jgi:hypothetical protein
MKSIGVFATRFTAMVVLFAPAVTAQAQGVGYSVCDSYRGQRVCNYVYYPPPPPPPPPPPEPPVKHTIGTEETILFDAAAEARKALSRASQPRTEPGLASCPPPYPMTRDGCQK